MEATCWSCGKEILKPISEKDKKLLDSLEYTMDDVERIFAPPRNRCYCEECRAKKEAEDIENIRRQRVLKNLAMYERGLSILERQDVDMYEHREACNVIREFIDKNNAMLNTEDWKNAKEFGSADEVAVAIVLVENEIKTVIQKKIGNNRVDFYIPSLKVILEVDGELYHTNKGKDIDRDLNLRDALGDEWEVIHIPTKYIHKNIELLPEAIKSLKAQKKKERSLHRGLTQKESRHLRKSLQQGND